MNAVISYALRSATFPVCLIECLLDIARAPLHIALHLLRNAFRLLGFVTSQFSNLLLDLARNVLGSAFHLIAVHDVPPSNVAHARSGPYCDSQELPIGVSLNVM